MSGRFDELRREYPQFVYSGYSVSLVRMKFALEL